MKLSRRQFLQLVAGVAALPIARVASAETYPARPIRSELGTHSTNYVSWSVRWRQPCRTLARLA